MQSGNMTTGDVAALVTLPLPFTTLGLHFFTISGQYVPEVYILMWAAIALLTSSRRLRIAKSLILSKIFVVFILLILAISIFSFFRSDFNPIAFYGRLRALLLSTIGSAVVFISVQKKWDKELVESLIIVCSSACVMFLAASLVTTTQDSSKVGISMLCYSVAACLLVERRRPSFALIIVALSGISAYLSFFRQNYILSVALIVTTLFFAAKQTIRIEKTTIKINSYAWLILLIPMISTIGVTHYWDEINNFLTSSESRYIQSIGKTKELIEFINTGAMDESGNSRVENYVYFIENFWIYLLPNGLIDDSNLYLQSVWGGGIYNPGASVTRDSIFAYLVVTFGFGVFTLGAGAYLVLLVLNIRNSPNKTLTRLLYLSPGLVAALLLDGATLTQFQKSLFFGIALALLLPLRVANHNKSTPSYARNLKTNR